MDPVEIRKLALELAVSIFRWKNSLEAPETILELASQFENYVKNGLPSAKKKERSA